jgi:hypothetical protein
LSVSLRGSATAGTAAVRAGLADQLDDPVLVIEHVRIQEPQNEQTE